MNDKTPKIYLSRRNLLTLLSKLDRDAAGEDTACSIIKQQTPGPAYQQTMARVMVIAVQDEEYYGAQQRPASEMHPAEEAKLTVPSTGLNPLPVGLEPWPAERVAELDLQLAKLFGFPPP